MNIFKLIRDKICNLGIVPLSMNIPYKRLTLKKNANIIVRHSSKSALHFNYNEMHGMCFITTKRVYVQCGIRPRHGAIDSG